MVFIHKICISLLSHTLHLTSYLFQLRHFQAADTWAKQKVLNCYFFILVDFFSHILRWTFLTPKTIGILTLGLRTPRNELEVSIRFQTALRPEGVWERQNVLETPLLVNVVEFKAAAVGTNTQELFCCCCWRLGDLHTSTSRLSQALNSNSK